jgi:hypothetical protein
VAVAVSVAVAVTFIASAVFADLGVGTGVGFTRDADVRADLHSRSCFASALSAVRISAAHEQAEHQAREHCGDRGPRSDSCLWHPVSPPFCALESVLDAGLSVRAQKEIALEMQKPQPAR